MSKHEQKVKAVKDLQEEYDRRSEMEEQAFALLAEGKFKEAQELLDSLDDKQALEMLKESVEEYGEEQTKRDVYCLMQHIRAFDYQSDRKENADFGLPCSLCYKQKRCDFNEKTAIEHLRKVDKDYMKCAIRQVEEYREQHGEKADMHRACTNCKIVHECNCNLSMPYAILQRIEII